MACAPFYYVGFADFWLADQLNSLVTVLLDAHYLICFYIHNYNWYHTSGKTETELFYLIDINYLFCTFQKLNLVLKNILFQK